MSDSEQQLGEIRDKIDQLDEQIQSLINERAACAQKVADIKQQSGSDVFYRPEREADVLKRVKARNQGPLSSEHMARLIREVMSACLALEKPMTIAYLGPEGTFTQSAALKHFGHFVNTTSLGAIDEVFREVEASAADYGIVPIENSTEGVVSHTLDMFLNSSLKICGEVELRIHHCLLSNEKKMDKIKKIYSHQQSFAQCREWINAHLSGVETIAVSSNAKAAKLAQEEKHAAAIAGETAAEIYELNILHKNIEDEPGNTTRFLVIGSQATGKSGDDKTSLMITAKNKPGALYSLLEPFSRNGISMTRIESRPSRRQTWDYVFFVDLEGHIEQENIKQALAEIEADGAIVKVLGAYPKAVL
jgi:chorismate mutase/prephenate dehydratase